MLKIFSVCFNVVNNLHLQNISNKYIFVHELNSEVLSQSFKTTPSKPNLIQYLFYVSGIAPDKDTLF